MRGCLLNQPIVKIHKKAIYVNQFPVFMQFTCPSVFSRRLSCIDLFQVASTSWIDLSGLESRIPTVPHLVKLK